ncbi:MAG: MerR family transcriptional regulator [Actinobacteria bacterium]|nr:MerR family transcriptional regulator [Actinomycetota bacterium]
MQPSAFLRIGEISRRTGVSPELLRAWERRYALLRPERTEGGFRLYSAEDEARVRRMKHHVEGGLAAAEAARLAKEAPLEPAVAGEQGGRLELLTDELGGCLESFDESGASKVIDRMFDTWSTVAVLRGVVLPYLHDLGERWEAGEVSIGQEHFASNFLRARLLSLGRGWDSGSGPLALLACAPGDRHELGLICFGIALRERGWRIAFLGADTPVESLKATADELRPQVAVVSAVYRDAMDANQDVLAGLASSHRLVLAGRGVDESFAEKIGASLLEGDPITAAATLA